MLSFVPQLMALKDSASAPVRPPANDPILLKRLLDIGFYNFLIPMVESADEAARAVSATRYPPQGTRGVSMVQRANRYGTVADYFTQVNDNICVLVQIESRKGVDAAERSAPWMASMASSSARPTSPPPAAISATPTTPRCRPRWSASSAPPNARARRSASSPRWRRTHAATGSGAAFVAVGLDQNLFRDATRGCASASPRERRRIHA